MPKSIKKRSQLPATAPQKYPPFVEGLARHKNKAFEVHILGLHPSGEPDTLRCMRNTGCSPSTGEQPAYLVNAEELPADWQPAAAPKPRKRRRKET